MSEFNFYYCIEDEIAKIQKILCLPHEMWGLNIVVDYTYIPKGVGKYDYEDIEINYIYTYSIDCDTSTFTITPHQSSLIEHLIDTETIENACLRHHYSPDFWIER
jgi:hypothetical protein